jgi:hypothetical protein
MLFIKTTYIKRRLTKMIRLILAFRKMVGFENHDGAITLAMKDFFDTLFKDMDAKLRELTEKDKAGDKEAGKEKETLEKNKEGLEKLYKEKWFDERAEKIIDYIIIRAKKYLNKGDKEDMLQETSIIMWNKGKNWWLKMYEDYNKKQGKEDKELTEITAEDLKKLFNTACVKEAEHAKRNVVKQKGKQNGKRYHETNFQTIETDEGEVSQENMLESKKEVTNPFEKEDIKKLQKGLLSYVKEREGKGEKGLIYIMLSVWLDSLTKSTHIENLRKFIINHKEVKEVKQADGTTYSEKSIENAYVRLQKMIVSYFKEEVGVESTEWMEDVLQMTASVKENSIKIFASAVLFGYEEGFEDPEEVAKEIEEEKNMGKKAFIAKELVKIAKEIIGAKEETIGERWSNYLKNNSKGEQLTREFTNMAIMEGFVKAKKKLVEDVSKALNVSKEEVEEFMKDNEEEIF